MGQAEIVRLQVWPVEQGALVGSASGQAALLLRTDFTMGAALLLLAPGTAGYNSYTYFLAAGMPQ